jgi:hypothetical protein
MKSAKRKTESYTYGPVYVESCLLQLCRRGKWSEVLERCQQCPEEANLVPFYRSTSVQIELASRDHAIKQVESVNGQDDVPVFRETPLGIALGGIDLGKNQALPVIQALVKANPRQISASQLQPGHTSLRDAVLNSSCTPQILKLLIEATATYSDGILAFRYEDQGGLTLMDHLVTAVHLDYSVHSMEMIELFFRMQPLKYRKSQKGTSSPLILILTLGHSSDLKYHPSTTIGAQEGEGVRLDRVLQVTKLLLDDDPSLLFQFSRVSQCSPLHVALRNYGTFEPLILELTQRDKKRKLLKHRNLYGDLPLHVACSVGVPQAVLKLVLHETISVSCSFESNESRFTLNPLTWSTNTSRYTPIDLEWVRHIESGNGFYTARTFYPLEVAGVKRHCFKQDEYYKELLREAVDHVIHGSVKRNKTTTREEEARLTFGYLVDRIALLIKSASVFRDGSSVLIKETSLSDVCKLCTPYSPSLPLPLLELFLWLRSDDLLKADSSGMLPLHCVLSLGDTYIDWTFTASSNATQDWLSFVCQLLDASPESSRMENVSGQLPLHMILHHRRNHQFLAHDELQQARHQIVEKLVAMYPEAVDRRDPISELYPFMMAAKDPYLSIDTVFCLLRHSPSRCHCHKTKHLNEIENL